MVLGHHVAGARHRNRLLNEKCKLRATVDSGLACSHLKGAVCCLHTLADSHQTLITSTALRQVIH